MHIFFDGLDQGLGVTAGTVVGRRFSSVNRFYDTQVAESTRSESKLSKKAELKLSPKK